MSIGPLHLDTYGASARALQKEQPENLTLDFSRCKEPGPAQGTQVTQVEWTEDDVLYCVVTIDANCSDDYWVGDYEIKGENELILEYTTIRAGGEDACLCQVELRYWISNLEQRDYTVTVRQTDLVRPQGTRNK
ncbi:MAG TPA: hypothetical protein ENN19_08455 [Chloroflexi bacterium]|nr:hypothetical protein [Chloroflexota bacterium]